MLSPLSNQDSINDLKRNSPVKKVSFVILILLLFVGIIFDKHVNNASHKLREASNVVVGTLSKPIIAAQNAYASAKELISLRDEVIQLKQENTDLKAYKQQVFSLQAQINNLSALLNYTPTPQTRHVAARVIDNVGGSYARSIMIDIGTNNGVKEGLSVVDGDGFVGRIISVTDKTSIVLLATDMNSSIAVINEQGSVTGILTGTNSQEMVLKYVENVDDLNVGDTLMSASSDQSIPLGISVGSISRIDGSKVYVTPSSDLRNLQIVRVLFPFVFENEPR